MDVAFLEMEYYFSKIHKLLLRGYWNISEEKQLWHDISADGESDLILRYIMIKLEVGR
jgi:hypothetical protein